MDNDTCTIECSECVYLYILYMDPIPWCIYEYKQNDAFSKKAKENNEIPEMK